ncbi:50S ribosomal protein L6 [Candidatus Pacearchaeota archaeon]|nr:50S ribosomal protein L6 [Candidatus Pacearchaeota archaeon]
MNKDLSRVIEIPEGTEVVINDKEVIVKGNGNELIKKFDKGKISLIVTDNKITISAKGATRRESKMIGTIWASINNMIKGVGENFVYTLEICNVHFPMNVKVEGDRVIIKSFIGETVNRIAKILPNVNVDIKGSQITISSCNIESAGQTAANLEKATKLTGRDRRIFQDGIFITEKPGRKI